MTTFRANTTTGTSQEQEELWDFEFDELYTPPNEELSPETLELIAADTTPLNLDEPLALDMPPVWML